MSPRLSFELAVVPRTRLGFRMVKAKTDALVPPRNRRRVIGELDFPFDAVAEVLMGAENHFNWHQSNNWQLLFHGQLRRFTLSAPRLMARDLSQFYNRTRAAQKIIVVDLGFLGDSVHLIPALWEIKRNYPTAELHTLSALVGAELLRLVPCVAQAWAFPLGPPSPPWWRHWDIIQSLRRQHFDIALTFSGADRTVFLTALTGARWRLAHAGARKHFWSSWLVLNWVSRRSNKLPVFQQRLEVLGVCGLEPGTLQWDLKVPDEARKQAEGLVPRNALHLSINASTPFKEWPLTNWIDLARRLLAEDPNVRLVSTASPNLREQERLRLLAAAVNDPRCIPLPAGLSIPQLAASLQRCALHVGADSGVLHLAAALGLPTIALFRDYPNASEWLPQGPKHRHLLAPCQCLRAIQTQCAQKGEALCLGGIMPNQVLALIKELCTK